MILYVQGAEDSLRTLLQRSAEMVCNMEIAWDCYLPRYV